MRARFPNPNHILLPGMFVRARVEEGMNHNAVPVPVPAVSHDPQGNATVLLVGPDRKLSQRTVQASKIVNGTWLVEAGLNDGEQVVVSGGQKAQPGMLVNAVQARPGTATAVAAGGAPTAGANNVIASETK
jgi:membrane fusion protein (multidrug efflux system)